jgi:AcrR family transcriptional regulator
MTATTPMTDAPPRERKRQRLLQRVQAVAMREFTARGYESVTIAEICDAAEVPQSTFFRHFGTKEAIVQHLMQVTLGKVAERLAGDQDTAGLIEPYLRALEMEFRDIGYSDPDFLYRSVKVVTSPRVRSVYLEGLGSAHAAMDSEIAKRLGLTPHDPRIRSIRTFQWVAADQAMSDLTTDETLDDLIERTRVNLSLLKPFESLHVRD